MLSLKGITIIHSFHCWANYLFHYSKWSELTVMSDKKVASPAVFNSAEMLSVHSDLYIFSFSVQSHLQNTCAFILMNLLCALHLPNSFNPKYTQQLSPVILLLIEHITWPAKMTILILYLVPGCSSYIQVQMQVPIILVFTILSY